MAQQTIGDDVHAAYVDLGTARSELQTRRKAVQLATENYEVVGKRYKNGLALLTSSLRHPKILIKEFSYFLMPCHQHGLRINLLV